MDENITQLWLLVNPQFPGRLNKSCFQYLARSLLRYISDIQESGSYTRETAYNPPRTICLSPNGHHPSSEYVRIKPRMTFNLLQRLNATVNHTRPLRHYKQARDSKKFQTTMLTVLFTPPFLVLLLPSWVERNEIMGCRMICWRAWADGKWPFPTSPGRGSSITFPGPAGFANQTCLSHD